MCLVVNQWGGAVLLTISTAFFSVFYYKYSGVCLYRFDDADKVC